MSSLEDLEPAYFAGLLDGEGYFVVRKNSPEIKVDMVVPGVLHELKALFGGSVTAYPARRPGHRPTWRWRVCGDAARECAQVLLPFLRVKHAEAQAVAYSMKYRAGTVTGDWLRAAAKETRAESYPAVQYENHA